MKCLELELAAFPLSDVDTTGQAVLSPLALSRLSSVAVDVLHFDRIISTATAAPPVSLLLRQRRCAVGALLERRGGEPPGRKSVFFLCSFAKHAKILQNATSDKRKNVSAIPGHFFQN